MELLKSLSEEPFYKTDEKSIHHQFGKLRHYIGRFGNHIRIASNFVSAAPRLGNLLTAFEVKYIPTPRSDTIPVSDEEIRLDGVLRRMLQKDARDLPFYQQALKEMDEKMGLSSIFAKSYKNPNVQPRVHAEIQVLDHFHKHRIPFAGDDRYIACSKPACYCCELYFKHHPGSYELPPSHKKIYLKWKPPEIEPGCNSEDRKRKEDVINSMNKDIREGALRQISQRRLDSRHAHLDSTTGITSTVDRENLTEAAVSSLQGTVDSDNPGVCRAIKLFLFFYFLLSLFLCSSLYTHTRQDR